MNFDAWVFHFEVNRNIMGKKWNRKKNIKNNYFQFNPFSWIKSSSTFKAMDKHMTAWISLCLFRYYSSSIGETYVLIQYNQTLGNDS